MTDPDLLTVQRDVDSPPGGWKYTVPQTGVLITGRFFTTLRSKVIAHLKANGHVVDDEMLAMIEDGACRETRPPGWCRKRPPKPVGKGPLPLLMYAEKFVKCAWEALVSRKFVPREEAERRLAICMTCPLRSTTPSGCSGCYTLLKKANALLETKGALKVEPDPDGVVRDACSACWCLISLKSWMTNATLDKCEGSVKPPYQEGHCWRLGR